MNLYLAKWWQTITITWVKHSAYRLNFLLQIIGPSIVFFFIKYQLWKAIYTTQKQNVINGFSFDEMIHYHLWSFFIGMIAQGFASWNLSEDIRMGRISSYLIYPFKFHEFHLASFISFLSIQLVIGFFTLMVLTITGLMTFPPLLVFIKGTLFCLYISFFWFALQYLIGILAFWLEETWIMRVILSIVANFLSGAIIPLDFFPQQITSVLNWTPFPYMTYYPIQLLTEKVELTLGPIAILSVWFILILLLSKIVWKKGIKMYTAAGM